MLRRGTMSFDAFLGDGAGRCGFFLPARGPRVLRTLGRVVYT